MTTAEGVLEILPKGFGFLRSADNAYKADRKDIHVPRSMISKYRLKEGSFIVGVASPAQRQKRSAQLKEIHSIDTLTLPDHEKRPDFAQLTSVDPFERLRIDESGDLSMRALDLITPIGKGQRGLIVSPPRTGKTTLLQKLAMSISEMHPEVHLMVLLIDERPEEVTEIRRATDSEVFSSSSDEMSKNHVRLAEIVLERSRRMVESGQDVVILLDSITRMARAYNREHRSSGRTLSGGLSVGSMTKPREFFGAARKAEEGGSLTIIATALIDTGSRMDDVIFEEFKGTGNMELVLDRKIAERRIWPAIDIRASGTRKEEKLRDPQMQNRINVLRRVLSDLPPDQAMQMLLTKLDQFPDNETFLKQVSAG